MDSSEDVLIHGDFASPGALRRMAELGIGMNAQPQIKSAISDLMVGAERSLSQWPFVDGVVVHEALGNDG